MSDSVVESKLSADGVDALQTTAGDILKNARQSAGIHIEALAVALKVPVSKLEALESNNFDLLSDTVFLRALASSVCRTLKLDPASVLSLLPQSQAPRLIPERTDINTPVKTAGKTFVTTKSSRHSSWLTASVLLLLAGAAAVFYWPAGYQPWDAWRTKQIPAVAVPAAPEPVPPDAATAPVSALPTLPSATTVSESVPVSIQMSASQPSSSVAQAAAPVTLQPADPVVAPESVNVPLMVRTRGESWVQVRDAAGRVVFEKKMVQGDSAPVSGVLPFSVVIGRADVTDVYVRGKLFELNSVSRENVARFEVKQ